MLNVRSKTSAFLILLAFPMMSGCQGGTLPDPNDPQDIGKFQVGDSQAALQTTSDFLNWRRNRGEISNQKEADLIAKRADQLLSVTDTSHVLTGDAWRFGEMYLAAHKWDAAARVLEIAVAAPPDTGRWMTDNLRLARAYAQLGRVPEAIARARAVFACADYEAAPILPAVVLEIAPAAFGKGHDRELAQLLLDAIPQVERVKFDRKSEGGQAFILAKPFHIRRAYQMAVEAFLQAGDDAGARRAQKSYDSWQQSIRNA